MSAWVWTLLVWGTSYLHICSELLVLSFFECLFFELFIAVKIKLVLFLNIFNLIHFLFKFLHLLFHPNLLHLFSSFLNLSYLLLSLFRLMNRFVDLLLSLKGLILHSLSMVLLNKSNLIFNLIVEYVLFMLFRLTTIRRLFNWTWKEIGLRHWSKS